MTGRAQHFHLFDTTAGVSAIAWSDAGVTRFQLPASSTESAERHLRRRLPVAAPAPPPPDIVRTIAEVQRYFAGDPVDFSTVRLDLGDQDPFFTRVYAAARRIAWGQTTTYGALAHDLGAGPETARDVGQAMARNPVPLLIPCHRVLAAGGKVGGFSAPGGSTTKARMLEIEGVALGPPDQRSFAF